MTLLLALILIAQAPAEPPAQATPAPAHSTSPETTPAQSKTITAKVVSFTGGNTLTVIVGKDQTAKVVSVTDGDTLTIHVGKGQVTAKVIYVTDGDTLTILVGKVQVKIRLAGIDAPEKGQDFGNKAKEALANMVKGKTVVVETQGLDKYMRTIGTIKIGDTNVNLEMVKQGMAWRYPQYDKEETYLKAEQEARKANLGLWKDKDPITPWEWPRGIVGS